MLYQRLVHMGKLKNIVVIMIIIIIIIVFSLIALHNQNKVVLQYQTKNEESKESSIQYDNKN